MIHPALPPPTSAKRKIQFEFKREKWRQKERRAKLNLAFHLSFPPRCCLPTTSRQRKMFRTPSPSTPGSPTGGQRPALAACRARALHPHFTHVDSYGTWSLVTGFFLPGSPITWPVSALGPRQGWAASHCVTPRSVDPSFRLRTSGRPAPSAPAPSMARFGRSAFLRLGSYPCAMRVTNVPTRGGPGKIQ